MNREDIPGLNTLENVHAAINEFWNQLKKNNVNEWPDISEDDLIEKYPDAAALLLAEEWGRSDKPFKAAAGQVAARQILDGRDCKEAIRDMIIAWAKTRN